MKHNWKCIDYNKYYTIFKCDNCNIFHKTVEDNPDTWLINIKEDCKFEEIKNVKL